MLNLNLLSCGKETSPSSQAVPTAHAHSSLAAEIIPIRKAIPLPCEVHVMQRLPLLMENCVLYCPTLCLLVARFQLRSFRKTAKDRGVTKWLCTTEMNYNSQGQQKVNNCLQLQKKPYQTEYWSEEEGRRWRKRERLCPQSPWDEIKKNFYAVLSGQE